jgi:hypothetical protein
MFPNQPQSAQQQATMPQGSSEMMLMTNQNQGGGMPHQPTHTGMMANHYLQQHQALPSQQQQQQGQVPLQQGMIPLQQPHQQNFGGMPNGPPMMMTMQPGGAVSQMAMPYQQNSMMTQQGAAMPQMNGQMMMMMPGQHPQAAPPPTTTTAMMLPHQGNGAARPSLETPASPKGNPFDFY